MVIPMLKQYRTCIAALVGTAIFAKTGLTFGADGPLNGPLNAPLNGPLILPPNHPLIASDISAFHLTGSAARTAISKIVNVTGPEFTKALHVDVLKRSASDYDLQYALPVDTALNKGDIVWLSVWVRMLHTGDESGQGVFGLVLEESKDKYDKVLVRRISVTRDWTRIAVPAKLNATYAAGDTHISMRLGGAAQTLEIAEPQLLRFDDPAAINIDDLPQTRITYVGREPDAPWRKDAAERIEQIRKAPIAVHVVDADGKPVAGAKVTVAMTQHSFPFGSCYDSNLLVGPNSQTADAKAYQQHFAELFNVGVDENGMKWPSWENPDTRNRTLAAWQWMSDHDIKVRGHNLVWPSWRYMPNDLQTLKDKPGQLRARTDAHITDEVSTLGNKVTEWDVVNEPYVNNDLLKILGYGEMAHWFKVAHAANPTVPLMLNETSVPTAPPKDQHYDVLFQQAKAIQDEGGPIAGIGMQAHFGSELTSPTDLKQIYDRFATLNMPVEITELDIDVIDQQLQADYLRDLMTMSFSHPNIKGIMMWGFAANHHWKPDAALFTSDYTIKPAGRAWMDLVKKQWWTNADLTTSADGQCSTRGFLGDYKITASDGTRSVTTSAALSHDGQTVTVTLK